MLVPQYPMGFDHGNSETKGYIIGKGGRSSSYKMPSMLSIGSLKDIANKRSLRGDTYEKPQDALASDEIVITYEGTDYLVGELALRESHTDGSTTGDVGRYASTRALIMLMALSVKMLPVETEYTLHVTTGLPVELFTNENRKAVRWALESGEKPYTFQYNGLARRMYVTVAKVVMEGIGTLITYGEEGGASLQGVIDIGADTTDLIVTRGIKPVSTWCKGNTIGVKKVGEILSTHFEVHYGRPLGEDEKRMLLLAYSARKPLPQLVANGRKVDMSQVYAWIETAISSVAEEILSFVRRIWRDREKNRTITGDILPLFISGGGTYYFAEHIKEGIDHAKEHAHAEFDNVQGYAHLAYTDQLLRQAQQTA